MTENWDIQFSDPACNHHEDCGCVITMMGKSPVVAGLTWTSPVAGGLTDQYRAFSAWVNVQCKGLSPNAPTNDILSEIEYFRAQLPENGTIKLIAPPINDRPSWPHSVELFKIDKDVVSALRRADYRYFRSKYDKINVSWDFLSSEVWNDDTPHVPSLLALCMRQQSMVHWCLGKTNGRMHVVSAMSELFPRKMANSILSVARQEIGDRPREPLKFIDEALDHLYRSMKIDMEKKDRVSFSLKPLEGMYLGASNGITSSAKWVIPPSEDNPVQVKVSSKGKKIDTFEQDLETILEFLRTGKAPPIYWNLPMKDENFFSYTKQMSDEEWFKWTQKVRTFFIPSGVFILLERLVSHLRHLKERGHVIRVGHRHARGGAQTLAKLLGITRDNCFEPLIVEGDGKNFDQTVREFFVNLYFSTMLVHMDPSSPDYEVFQLITKFLLENITTRITKLFGDVWAIVKGGVPSGAFNTSHMDSWIMALYFMLFCVYQIHTAPKELQEELELHFIKVVRVIVYGDDHLWNKGKGAGAIWFSGVAFASFMKKHFDCDIRDLKDGVPFCSMVKDGWIIKEGATFLKHQHILNPYVDLPGQPDFIPFRESREILIRCLYGRQTKPRDVVDTMLSCLGHAHATYAANRDCYDRLYLLYSELLSTYDTPESIQDDIRNRLDHDDLKRIRQSGLTPEELISGFPTWDSLIQKNVYDAVYQDISAIPFDIDEEIADYADELLAF